jgi:hypothetical protein
LIVVFPAGSGPVAALSPLTASLAEEWGAYSFLGTNYKMKIVSSHEGFFTPDFLI